MNKDYNTDITPEVREKMKKNLIYIGIISIFMMFAGLTSGYIVSMGDSFWVKFPMPKGFWISTAIIVISSIAIQLGVTFAKKGAYSLSKLFVTLTFILGLLFVYFQLKGYGQLNDSGSYFVSKIMVVDGRYGSQGEGGRYYGYYEIKNNGNYITLDGNDYLMNGKKLTKEQFASLKKFTSQFENYKVGDKLKISNYGKPYTLLYKSQEVSYIDGNLMLPDSTKLGFVDLERLQQLSVNIRDERGDFFLKGKIGKDFHVYFKGKELDYKNRLWEYKGQVLDDYLQTKPLESADTASSYLFLITFLHLLHIIVTLFYMGKMTVHSLTGKITSENTLSLRLGAIFWHFLGVIWVYLLLFLLYIH